MNLLRLLLLFTLSSLVFSMSAQDESTNKTNYFAGGSISFLNQNNTYPFSAVSINAGIGGIYSNNSNEVKNIRLFLSPYVGRQLNDHWTIGIRGEYELEDYEAKDVNFFILGEAKTYDIINKGIQLGLGVFSRYVIDPENSFDVFFQPYLSYHLLQEKNYHDTELVNEEKANYFNLGLNTGILYRITKKWNATLHIGGINYVNGQWENSSPEEGNDFDSFNLQFSLSSLRLGTEFCF